MNYLNNYNDVMGIFDMYIFYCLKINLWFFKIILFMFTDAWFNPERLNPRGKIV